MRVNERVRESSGEEAKEEGSKALSGPRTGVRQARAKVLSALVGLLWSEREFLPVWLLSTAIAATR